MEQKKPLPQPKPFFTAPCPFCARAYYLEDMSAHLHYCEEARPHYELQAQMLKERDAESASVDAASSAPAKSEADPQELVSDSATVDAEAQRMAARLADRALTLHAAAEEPSGRLGDFEPNSDWPVSEPAVPDLPEALIFYPTNDEFADPMGYIQSIAARASDCGICKIVPPNLSFLRGKRWHDVVSPKTFLFPTKVQSVHELQHRSTSAGAMPVAEKKSAFAKQLSAFLIRNGFVDAAKRLRRDGNHQRSADSPSADDMSALNPATIVENDIPIDLHTLFGLAFFIFADDIQVNGATAETPAENDSYAPACEPEQLEKPNARWFFVTDAMFPLLPDAVRLERAKLLAGVFDKLLHPLAEYLAVNRGYIGLYGLNPNDAATHAANPERAVENTARRRRGGGRTAQDTSFGYATGKYWTLEAYRRYADSFFKKFFGSSDPNKRPDGKLAFPPPAAEDSKKRSKKEKRAKKEKHSKKETRHRHKPSKSIHPYENREGHKLQASSAANSDSAKIVSSSTKRKRSEQDSPVPLQLIEETYWRIVDGAAASSGSVNSAHEVFVSYGSDLDVSKFGSGFDMGADELRRLTQEHSPCTDFWDMNIFAKSPGSLFHFLRPDEAIGGVTVPMVYVGMLFASFAWHVEDNWLYSVNYMHAGAPKQWYGVPGHSADKLEAAMKAELPMLFAAEGEDLLFRLVTMLSPRVLLKHDVPVFRLVQNPGDIIITFPRAYHGGMSTGVNAAESCNFALPDWLPLGRECTELYRKYARSNVLSIDKLLFDTANHALTRATGNPIVLDELSLALKREAQERQALLSNVPPQQYGRSLWQRIILSAAEFDEFDDTEDDHPVISREAVAQLPYLWHYVRAVDWNWTVPEAQSGMSTDLDAAAACKLGDNQAVLRESRIGHTDINECTVCRYDCYFSGISCSCQQDADKFSCLRHAREGCTCALSTKTMVVRLMLAEISATVTAVRGAPETPPVASEQMLRIARIEGKRRGSILPGYDRRWARYRSQYLVVWEFPDAAEERHAWIDDDLFSAPGLVQRYLIQTGELSVAKRSARATKGRHGPR